MADVKRILYVDGDGEACLLMRDLVAPYSLDVAGSEEEGRALVYQHSYDLYIVASSGGGPPLGFCEWLQRVDGRTPIVYCSSNGTRRDQDAAVAAGAVRYLVKPLDPTLLRSTLSLLLKLAELESARALALEQQAIQDALLARARHPSSAGASAGADEDLRCLLRAKAYRAFRQGGGNRANFERMWPATIERVLREGAG